MANEFRIKNGLISNGAATISGSVTATGNITAPQLIGTASVATYWSGSVKHVESASFAVSASWAPGGGSAFPYTGSAGISGSLNVSGSITSTGSVNIRGGLLNISGSITTTGSIRVNGFMNIGANTVSSGSNSLAQGSNTNRANGLNASAFGQDHTVTGQSAAAHGGFNTARGIYSHAEGASNVADGLASHAEGTGTNAVGEGSHTEGGTTFANGYASHAEGDQSIANGGSSHAEGFLTEANGDYSNSQGETTYANGYASHTEGLLTMAVGAYSHAEGASTETLGAASHAEGVGSKTISEYQHAQGIYNLPISGAGAFFIGNGDAFTQGRRNLLFASGSSFQITGSATISGSLFVNGTQITGGGGSAFPYTGSAAITGSLRVTGSINTNLNADALGFVQDVSQSYSLGKQWIASAYRIIDASGSIVHTRAYGSADSRIGITKGLLSIPDFGAFGRFPSEIAGMTTQFGGDFAAISTQYNQTTTPGTLVNLSNVDNENFQTQIVMDNAKTDPSMEMKMYDSNAQSHQISISKNFPGWVISNNMTNPTMSLFRISNSASFVVFEVTQDQKVRVNGTEITAGGGSAFPYTGSAEITGSLSVNNILLAGRAENLLLGEKSVYGVTPYISASGAGNIAIGQTSLPFAISTGTNNIGIGNTAGNSLTTGQSNIMIGFQAGIGTTVGSYNTLIGESALEQANNKNNNVAIGYYAGAQASANRCVMIGANAGDSGDTGDDCVYVGNNAKTGANTSVTNEIAIGADAIGNGSNTVMIGNTNITAVYNGADTAAWNTTSDARDKTNIQPLSQSLNIINQIETVTFEWNKRDGSRIGKKQVGFTAQNLLAAQTGSAIADYLSLVNTNNPDQLTVNQSDLIPLLVKAVQELSAEVAALRAQINP